MNLKVGDVVWLKSGGPQMTVELVTSDGREANCAWFASTNELQRHVFISDMLTTNDPAPRPRVQSGAAQAEYKVYAEGDD